MNDPFVEVVTDTRNNDTQQFYKFGRSQVKNFLYKCIIGPFRELGESGHR